MSVKSFFKKNRSTFVMILILFSVRWSLADQYRVPTGSMEPTVHVGDHIAVNKMAYDLKVPFTNYVLLKTGEPKRGDIVVFKFPVDETQTYVKRLIGLPGDHLVINDGQVSINGQPIEIVGSKNSESYFEIWKHHEVEIKRSFDHRTSGHYEIEVPENMYFFMGDNRDNSYDSRFWGFVPRKNLKGQAHFVLWNVSLNGFMPHSELTRFGHVFP